MAFSDAFARGYEIGDAVKKRFVIGKFFKKFGELTKDSEEDAPVDSIGGIDVPQDADLDTDTKAAVEGAIPVTKAATQEGSNKDAEIPGTMAAQAVTAPSPPDERLLPPASGPAYPAALPEVEVTGKRADYSASAQRALPTEEGPAGNEPMDAGAIPMDASGRAKIKSPNRIPLKTPEGERRKSLTQANIKELDRLAMNAARASGDIGVYTALQKTTDSFLQGKVLKGLAAASASLTNGDIDGTEQALKNAYRFIPDGQEAKFHRSRNGTKLMVKDPWDNKDVELTPDRIQMFGMMIHNPDKWAELMRSDRKDAQQAAQEERRTKSQEQQVSNQASQFAQEFGIKKDDQKLKEMNARVSRLTEYEQALYYRSMAGKAAAAAKNGASMEEFLDESRLMSESVDKGLQARFTPPVDSLGDPIAGWKQPEDAFISDPTAADGTGRRPINSEEINRAAALAQNIAMANMGDIGTNTAGLAALQIVKAQLDPQHFNANIDPQTGVMQVPLGGGLTTPVRIPLELARQMASQANAKAAAEAATKPAPWNSAQFAAPTGP
jgi:hypothetical protein